MAKDNNMLGSWAFIIGVIVAIAFALIPTTGTVQMWIYYILLIIGVIIGFLNITDKEAEKFMWAGLVLVLVSFFGGQVFVSVKYVGTFLNNVAMLFVPATIIVVLKSIFGMAKK